MNENKEQEDNELQVDAQAKTTAAETILSTPEQPADTPVAPSPRSKKPIIMAAALALVIAAAVGVWASTRPDTPKPAQNNQTISKDNAASPKPSKNTESTNIDTAKAVVQYTATLVEGAKVDTDTQRSGPPYRVSGYNFVSYTSRGQSASYGGTVDKAKAAHTTFVAMLKKMGYKDVTHHIVGAGSDLPDEAYANDDVHCSVSVSNTPTLAAPYTATLACSDTSDYVAAAKATKPFYDLYVASLPTSNKLDPNTFIMNIGKEEASKTPGYLLISAGVGDIDGGGAKADFYKTPDGTWHYFLARQEPAPCDKYNTVDLKKAYLGYPCYVSATSENKQVTL